MAEMSISNDAKFSDGDIWTIESTLDQNTGAITVAINDQVNGKSVFLAPKTSDDAVAYFEKLKNIVKDDTLKKDLDTVIIARINDQRNTLTEQYKSLDKNKESSTNNSPKELSKTTEPVAEAKEPDDKNVQSFSANNAQDTSKSTATDKPNKRQYNPLSQFSSSTYKISLYSITPEALETFNQLGKWEISQMLLLVQSGGINNAGPVKRADGFELDFFIDNLEIDTLTNAKETGIASNSFTFKFQIFEPYGMTFPSKLVANQVKIQQLGGTGRDVKTQIEALQGHYLLILRFYGYDDNGKLLTATNFKGSSNNTDQQAVFERSFPIIINKFHFKIDGKTTIYDITAKSVSEQVALGSKRSEINTSFNVVGATVSEVIGGLGKTTNGLLDKFNQQQEEFVKTKKQAVADIYEVVYETNSKIKDAVIVDEDLNKNRAPLVDIKNASDVNERTAAAAAATIVKKQRTMPIGSGTTILQAIDLIISQSTYVTDALTFKDKEVYQPVQDEKIYDENAHPKTISWYIISPQVTPLKKFDHIRMDYAYRITFVIKQYDIPYVRSTSVKYVPKYPGPHKIYNYWYTGKNTEVLNYEQSYDLLYFNAAALSSEATNENAAKSNVPNVPKAAQGATSVSVASGAFESANTIRTFLYSPKDQLHAKIKILGDPDFLMPSVSGTIGQIMQKFYGEDYTINPNSGQVFIEIKFNQVEDYVNGLLKPNGKIDFWDFKDNSEMSNLMTGMVYMVTRVTSRFSRGVFTQDLKTIIPNFNDLKTPDLDKTTTGADITQGRPENTASSTANLASTQGDIRKIENTITEQSGRDTSNNSNNNPTNNKQQTTPANIINNEKPLTYTPLDDQVIEGPMNKRKYTQENIFTRDPANKSSRYYGLTSTAGGGRGVVNPPTVNQ